MQNDQTIHASKETMSISQVYFLEVKLHADCCNSTQVRYSHDITSIMSDPKISIKLQDFV